MKTIQEAMLEFSIHAPVTIIYDGNIQRFKNEGDKNNNSWYVAYDNTTFQSGAFGCWKLDVSEKFCSIELTHLTSEQKQRHAKQLAEQNILLSLKKSNNSVMFKSKLMKDLTAQ